MDAKVHDEASDVDNEQGEILVSGPDGVAVSLTPRAALATADSLKENVAETKRKDSPKHEPEKSRG